MDKEDRFEQLTRQYHKCPSGMWPGEIWEFAKLQDIEVARLRAAQPELALAAAQQYDIQNGGMASVQVRYNPYESSWEAKADWSSGKKIQVTGKSAAESVELLVAQLAAEAEKGE